jgi:hypothetical protein
MNNINDFIDDLEQDPADNLRETGNNGYKFFELYQRYPSFKKSLQEVNDLIDPCCLIHNDLKLNNILIHSQWQQLLSKPDANIIKIIDWEKWVWGDPTIDLGGILGSYLRFWLKSLVITKDVDLQTSLRSATTPLEKIQPSLVAIVKSYLTHFPEIVTRYDSFLLRLMRFTGLALLEDLETDMFYQETFTNNRICMLQVAKTLLCNPEASVQAILGINSSGLQFNN